jgi:tetrathionate reductase subunit A
MGPASSPGPGGAKFYWQADLSKARFVVFVGANVFEGNYGPPLRVGWITERVSKGELEYAIVDPRGQKGIKEASRWISPKPGHDAAIALGVIRLLLEWGKYDARFLSAANKGAAKAIGEASWTNATWLVKMKDGQPERLLRASDLGLPKPKAKVGDKEVELDAPVVLVEGKPVAFNPNDEAQAVFGDLFVDTQLSGIPVKSALAAHQRRGLQAPGPDLGGLRRGSGGRHPLPGGKVCPVRQEGRGGCAPRGQPAHQRLLQRLHLVDHQRPHGEL